MRIFTTQIELKQYLTSKLRNVEIGFVPTMGALHEGHLSLIRESKANCDITVCSIFVNPTQFNNSADFEKYPSDYSGDIQLLESVDCDILFLPQNANEVYQNEIRVDIKLGELANVLEGEHRPGHFDGVIRVVKLFFEIIQPQKAYFGLKDYQQYLVICKMVEALEMNVSIVGCEIIRESSSLAMSSRNKRLSNQELERALVIQKALLHCKNNFGKINNSELEKSCFEMLMTESSPEYFKICNSKTLLTINEDSEKVNARAFVAAKIGEVRLIDNMEI